MKRNILNRPGTLLLVGGDARCSVAPSLHCERIASLKYGGVGALRRALSRITGGACSGVLVLTRLVGHSEYARLKSACKSCDVPFFHVSGSTSAVERLVTERGLRAGVQT